MDMVFYFLPAIIFIGAITSYEDIKFGKIRNKWIAIGIVFAILIYMLNFLFIGLDNIDLDYYKIFFSNSILSLLAGFLFYYFDIWSEGDGKLFFVYTLLIPLDIYMLNSVEYFPSFSLLVNIFIPYAFYAIINSMMTSKKRMIRVAFKGLFDKDLALSIVRLFSISWVVSAFLKIINLDLPLIIFCTSIILYSIISNLKVDNKIWKSFIIISILRLFVDKSIFNYQFWIYFLITVFVYKLLFKSFLKNLLFLSIQESCPVNKLKKGMVLASAIIKRGRKYMVSDNDDNLNKKGIYLKNGLILSEKEIKKIKKDKIKFMLPVYKRIPFAHLMFLGALITLILKGNILIFMINLFR